MRPLIFLLTLLSTPIFAWNSIGHRIIAQIAYDQLTPTAKTQVDALTDVMFHSPYPDARFSRASTWPDQIKTKTNKYNAWHYIDLPYVKDKIMPSQLSDVNVVTEIIRAEKIVSDKSNSPTKRAEYLSFLIHFVGDIHQPMHCVDLFSTEFPNGDRGGNDYPINSPIAKDLHPLWDRGLGLLVTDRKTYQFHYYQINAIAIKWMAEYPRQFFATKLAMQSPMQWALESHQIAVNFAYSLSENAVPSAQYIQQGQAIVREQIVLAGDRLADVLNQILSD